MADWQLEDHIVIKCAAGVSMHVGWLLRFNCGSNAQRRYIMCIELKSWSNSIGFEL